MINTEEIKQILTIATRAISPYNTQPWRFRITDDKVDVFILRSKNFFLKLEGVLEITLGALLENISEGAKSLGYNAQWADIKPIRDLDTPCVSIIFKQEYKEKYNIDHILNRNTNRTPYSKQLLTNEHKQHIQQLFNNDNIEVLFLENEEKDTMAEILEDLEFTRLSCSKLLNEMLNYIRINADNDTDSIALLNVNNLGLSKKTIQLIRRIKSNTMLRHFYRFIGTAKKEKYRNRQLLDNSGSLLVFNLIQRDYHSLVETGRIIQRILNEMQKLGIASMSYVSGLYLFDVLAENPEIFSNKEKNTILNCKWDMEALVAKNRQKIAFIIRAGYLHEKTQLTTQRKSINNLLL